MSELDLDRVSVRYDDTPAVREASLAIPSGGVMAVLGPSGCGKSTLLRAVAGLEPLTSGRVLVDGADLSGVPTHRRGCALMFQDGQLFGHLTVARNVGYPLRIRRRPAQEVSDRVAELLALVGLKGYDERLPATLSGGEQQRVALARALAVPPKVLLLDEPLAALDATLRERLAADLARILRDSGTTTLMVTHDHDEAFAVADLMAVMREGRIVQQGSVEEVWRRPNDAETALFLGYATVLEGASATAVTRAAGLAPAPAVALRRSALVVRDDGPLTATVIEVRSTPEQSRLVVRADELGVVHAVVAVEGHAGPGDRVRLAVEPARLARLAP